MKYNILIEGHRIDLEKGDYFERHVQNNTISELSSRQSSVTSSIKVRKTPRNYEFFEFLDQAGVTASKPYRILRCAILSESGAFITNRSRCFVDKVDDSYIMISLVDGYIDFLEQISNYTLNDINLSLLNHYKNVNTIIESWNQDLKYRYLLSDFNGNNVINLSGSRLNIDYQNPSASIKYIWDQCFNFTDYDYTGSIFQTDDFKGRFISFPRPVGVADIILDEITSQKNDFSYETVGSNQYIHYPMLLPNSFSDSKFLNTAPTSPDTYIPPGGDASDISGTLYSPTGKFLISGTFRLTCSGFVRKNDTSFSVIKWWVSDGPQDYNTLQQGEIDASDTDNNTVDITVETDQHLHIFVKDEPSSSASSTFLNDENGQLTNNLPGGSSGLGGITTKLEHLEGVEVDFDQVFGDIKIREFIKNVMISFGLTPFTDHENKIVEFLTIDELLDRNNAVDYSDNFIKVVETRFVYNTYAQKNYLRYKYNDKEADHFDGSIDVINENLKFEKEHYQSFLYAPEKEDSFILSFGAFLRSKIWEREIQEDSSIKYKELDGRFYLFKEEFVSGGIQIGSEELGEVGQNTGYYKAVFDDLPFQDQIDEYYEKLKDIIESSRVFDVIMKFDEIEFLKIDFRKLIYIHQMGRYFKIDSIKSNNRNDLYRVKLIELN